MVLRNVDFILGSPHKECSEENGGAIPDSLGLQHKSTFSHKALQQRVDQCCWPELQLQGERRVGRSKRLSVFGVSVLTCTACFPLRHWGVMVVHFVVRGRVQGVGFRWFVHREAAELGLRGTVRNTDAGEVEVIAAGDPETIAELREQLRKGSRGSRVDAVIEHELVASEGESLGPFQIEGAW